MDVEGGLTKLFVDFENITSVPVSMISIRLVSQVKFKGLHKFGRIGFVVLAKSVTVVRAGQPRLLMGDFGGEGLL